MFSRDRGSGREKAILRVSDCRRGASCREENSAATDETSARKEEGSMTMTMTLFAVVALCHTLGFISSIHAVMSTRTS